MIAPPLVTSSAVTPVTCSKAGRRAQLVLGAHLTMFPCTVVQRLLLSNVIGPLSKRVAGTLVAAPAAPAACLGFTFAGGNSNFHSVHRSLPSCCDQSRPSWERSNQPDGIP